MYDLGFFGKTTVVAVTAVAAPFGPVEGIPMKRRSYIISSDRHFHIDRQAAADPTTSLRLPPDRPYRISLFGGETLSVIRATGETDGSVWITEDE